MIDVDRIRALHEEIGGEDFVEVSELFIAEVHDSVARVLDGSLDLPGLEAEFHSIKGSSLNIGFSRLAKLAAEGEKMASAGHVPEVMISQLSETLVDSIAAFAECANTIEKAA